MYKCQGRGIAVLADRRLCLIRDGPDNSRFTIVNELVATICVDNRSGGAMVRTIDDRIIASITPDQSWRDITKGMVRPLTGSVSDIEEIMLMKNCTIVRTDVTINVFLKTSRIIRYKLDSKINLCSFGPDRAFIQTDNDRLYLLRTRTSNGIVGSEVVTERYDTFYRELPVKEIVCGPQYDIIIGCIGHACALFIREIENQTRSWPVFVPILFPPEERVCKAIVWGTKIIYISESGACYYTSDPDLNKADYSLKAEQIQSLKHYFVENAFVLNSSIIIQYNIDKLCLLQAIDQEPVILSFFDDKDIVNIVQIGQIVYFIDINGHVYQCQVDELLVNPTMIKIPFFERNPITSQQRNQRLRSAQNTVLEI